TQCSHGRGDGTAVYVQAVDTHVDVGLFKANRDTTATCNVGRIEDAINGHVQGACDTDIRGNYTAQERFRFVKTIVISPSAIVVITVTVGFRIIGTQVYFPFEGINPNTGLLPRIQTKGGSGQSTDLTPSKGFGRTHGNFDQQTALTSHFCQSSVIHRLQVSLREGSSSNCREQTEFFHAFHFISP